MEREREALDFRFWLGLVFGLLEASHALILWDMGYGMCVCCERGARELHSTQLKSNQLNLNGIDYGGLFCLFVPVLLVF